jgi:hypothetical protein
MTHATPPMLKYENRETVSQSLERQLTHKAVKIRIETLARKILI